MGSAPQGFCLAYVTCSTVIEAENIAKNIVESKLAACVNLVKGVQSIYRWHDQVEASDEVLLIIKTHQRLIQQLKEVVLKQHSYECPEFIVSEIMDGDASYLHWWDSNLKE